MTCESLEVRTYFPIGNVVLHWIVFIGEAVGSRLCDLAELLPKEREKEAGRTFLDPSGSRS